MQGKTSLLTFSLGTHKRLLLPITKSSHDIAADVAIRPIVAMYARVVYFHFIHHVLHFQHLCHEPFLMNASSIFYPVNPRSVRVYPYSIRATGIISAWDT